MFKFIKIIFFLFLLLTTATAFGKSTQYFETTLVHMFGSDCNSVDINFNIKTTA